MLLCVILFPTLEEDISHLFSFLDVTLFLLRANVCVVLFLGPTQWNLNASVPPMLIILEGLKNYPPYPVHIVISFGGLCTDTSLLAD